MKNTVTIRCARCDAVLGSWSKDYICKQGENTIYASNCSCDIDNYPTKAVCRNCGYALPAKYRAERIEQYEKEFKILEVGHCPKCVVKNAEIKKDFERLKLMENLMWEIIQLTFNVPQTGELLNTIMMWQNELKQYLPEVLCL